MNACAHPSDPTHHAKQQLDRSTHFHTTTQQSSHWLQWNAANSPPKLPLPLRRSPPKSNTPIPTPTPLITPNGIWIQSAVSPQYIRADRQTWDDMVSNISALLCYCDSERRAKNRYSFNCQHCEAVEVVKNIHKQQTNKILLPVSECSHFL